MHWLLDILRRRRWRITLFSRRWGNGKRDKAHRAYLDELKKLKGFKNSRKGIDDHSR